MTNKSKQGVAGDTPEEQAVDTRRIIELLRHRHPEPEWATFVELCTSTGFSSRRLDVFTLNLWPSNAFRSIAYEIKVSRQDFAKELRNPSKRSEAEQLAHECYFVVPQGLVALDEVPEGWGLIAANQGGLRQLKMATQRIPAPWPMAFIAAIARRTTDPRPKLPAAAWKIAGREVSEEEFVPIAEELLGKSVEQARRDAVHEVKRSPEYETLVTLQRVVDQACDTRRCTAEQFRAWLKAYQSQDTRTRLRLSREEVGLLRGARNMLSNLLNVVEEIDEL